MDGRMDGWIGRYGHREIVSIFFPTPTLVTFLASEDPGKMVVHSCNPSTQAKSRGS
jgi:hypothetical protein